MQEIADDSKQMDSSPDSERTGVAGRQVVAGISVGAGAFVLVMLLMVLALVRVPPSTVVRDPGRRSVGLSYRDFSRQIIIENPVSRLDTNVLGDKELQIRGYVRNTAGSAVTSADIKCFFATTSGGEVSFEFPLVIDSRLDEVSSGALLPKSRREFGRRIAGVREGIEPRMSRIEVIHVRMDSP